MTLSSVEDGRQSSKPPSPVSPGYDLRLASQAMQRAADAMIAATESFRKQFHAQQGVSASPVANGGSTQAGSDPAERSSGELGRDGGSPLLWLRFLETSPEDELPLPTHAGRSIGSRDPPHMSNPALVSLSGSSTKVADPNSPTTWSKSAASSASLPNMPRAPAPVVPTGPSPGRHANSYNPSGQHVDLVGAGLAGAGWFRSTRGDPHPYRPFAGARDFEAPPVATGPEAADCTPQRVGMAPTNSARARPHGLSRTGEVLLIFVISMGQMVMLAATAQGLVPARIIGNTFPDTSPGKLAWYSAAYGLTAGTFVLPSGRLGDVFGHKVIVVVGYLWLALWSFVAGFAPLVVNAGGQGTIFFCFSRAMQGIGSALVVPNGQGILGRAYPPGPRKNVVMSVFGAAAPFGFVVGAAMSSLFAEQAQWAWGFWTLAALCVALAALSILVLPYSPGRSAQLAKHMIDERLWVRLDVPGIVLGVGGLVLLDFAVNQAPIISWRTPYTYLILIIGAMLLAGLVFTQQHAQHPLFPVSAMHTSTKFVLRCTAAGWGCFGVWIYCAFTFLEVSRGWSPLTASAAMAPGLITGLIASLLTGILMSWGVRPDWIMLASMLSFLAGSLLFVTAPVAQSYWLNTFFGIIVIPFGMDMSNPAATILLSNSVSEEHQGVAASLVVTVVNYSMSLALGIAGTIQTQMEESGQTALESCRAAQYFGVGLGGLGLVLASASLLGNRTRLPRRG